MRLFKNKILFLLLIFIFSFQLVTPVSASGVIRKEETYTSTKKNEEHKFNENITEKGSEYKLLNVDYQIVKEEPETQNEAVSYVKKSKTLKSGTAYEPKETITVNGITYHLEYTQRDEVVSDDAYTQTVTGYTDYDSETAAVNAPPTKKVTVTNKKTNKQETVECDYVGISTLPAQWESGVINITFISYDKQYFAWQGILVEKNVSNPLAGYDKQIVESVGGNTDDYKVESVSWNGAAYANSNGTLCRNAVAKVKRKINRYRVSYKGEIRSSVKKGIVYTSTYTGLKKTETGNTIYTIKATATYKGASNTTAIIAGLTVGVVLFIILVIGIIYFLKKKQKK